MPPFLGMSSGGVQAPAGFWFPLSPRQVLASAITTQVLPTGTLSESPYAPRSRVTVGAGKLTIAIQLLSPPSSPIHGRSTCVAYRVSANRPARVFSDGYNWQKPLIHSHRSPTTIGTPDNPPIPGDTLRPVGGMDMLSLAPTQRSSFRRERQPRMDRARRRQTCMDPHSRTDRDRHRHPRHDLAHIRIPTSNRQTRHCSRHQRRLVPPLPTTTGVQAMTQRRRERAHAV